MSIKEINRGVHPRLAYTRDVIDSFKQRLDTDDEARKLVDTIRAKCEELLNREFLTEEYANSVYSQHGRFYELGDQINDFSKNFGFMYSLGETKYFDKMKAALLHFATFKAWTGPANKDRETPWLSDLSTTRILWGFAVAYDTMYDSFTEDERATIRRAMIDLGITPLLSDWMYDGVRVHALDSMGHNWWSVCTALAGCGILAIYEDMENSRAILSDILTSLRLFCEYDGEALLNKYENFDKKGMFYESANYFNYGVSELLRFIFSYKNCFEGDPACDIPILSFVGRAFAAMAYPTERGYNFVNFGDSSVSVSMLLIKYLLMIGEDDLELRKLYSSTEPGLDVQNWLYADRLYTDDKSAPVLPTSDLYDGLAFLRSSWEVDSTLLAVRCGYSWNHSHDDAGSFIIERGGVPLICDSGTVSYDRKDYKSYYCDAEAHNVVTVNGYGQCPELNYRGSKFSGEITHFIEDGSMAYLLCDATGPMSDRCLRDHRSFIRLTDDIFVTCDDLYTYAPADFAWLLHYNGEAEEACETGFKTLSIKGEKNVAKVSLITPADLTLEHREHDGKRYLAMKSEERSRLFNLISVIGLDCASEAEIKPLTGVNQYGVEIKHGGDSYRIYYNYLADGRNMHINSNNCLGGWETDAYIICDVNDGERVMMIYGSYLRRDGISYYENLRKQFTFVKTK